MKAGVNESPVHAQVYDLSQQFLPKEWIMEKWEEGYYITAMAGSTASSSLVVMSKGTPYTQQSYKVRTRPASTANGKCCGFLPLNLAKGKWYIQGHAATMEGLELSAQDTALNAGCTPPAVPAIHFCFSSCPLVRASADGCIVCLCVRYQGAYTFSGTKHRVK